MYWAFTTRVCHFSEGLGLLRLPVLQFWLFSNLSSRILLFLRNVQKFRTSSLYALINYNALHTGGIEQSDIITSQHSTVIGISQNHITLWTQKAVIALSKIRHVCKTFNFLLKTPSHGIFFNPMFIPSLLIVRVASHLDVTPSEELSS